MTDTPESQDQPDLNEILPSAGPDNRLRIRVGDDGEIIYEEPGRDKRKRKGKIKPPQHPVVRYSCLAILFGLLSLCPFTIYWLHMNTPAPTPTATSTAIAAAVTSIVTRPPLSASTTSSPFPTNLPTRTRSPITPTIPTTATPTTGVPTARVRDTLCFHPNEKFDGSHQRIIFASERDNTGRVDPFDLYVMDLDGSNVCRLTTSGGKDPSVSANGEYVAFVSGRSGNNEIFYMPARDYKNSQQRLTNGPHDMSPRWMPGTMNTQYLLLYNADPAKSNQPQLYITGLQQASQPAKLIIAGAMNFGGNWSHDGQNIAFVSERDGNRDIYVIDNHFANERRLTTDAGSDTSPVWSPDGKQIVFVSDRGSKDFTLQINIMNADGSNVRSLTPATGFNFQPRWSPDGKYIVFVSHRDNNDAEIYVMDANGTNQRRLTNSPGKDWSPDWGWASCDHMGTALCPSARLADGTLFP
jgi:TolB protein